MHAPPMMAVRSALAGAVLLVAACVGCTPVRTVAAPVVSPMSSGLSLIAQRLPRVEYRGGPFLRRPMVHTITFTSDEAALVTHLERFGDMITSTGWWRTVAAGYCSTRGDCIGAGTPGQHIRLPDRLPRVVSDVEIERLIGDALRRGQFGKLTPGALLVVYLPAGITLRSGAVSAFCAGGPRAVHQVLRLPERKLPYAIIPRCAGIDLVTVSASHEILEMATNPEPAARAFALVRSSSHLGFTLAGVEPADPCGLLASDGSWPREAGYALHRAWSNAAAARGGDPCVPTPPARPFVALIPQHATVRLEIGVVEQVTLEVAASRPLGELSVAAVDLTGSREGASYVSVSLSRDRAFVGDSLVLNLTLRKAHPTGAIVVGLLASVDGQKSTWPLAVLTSGAAASGDDG